VRDFHVDPILRAAREDNRVIQKLQRLLYSGDTLFRQRAADILGQVSAIIGETDPSAISKLLQRLFASITDTAASSWGAFEAIGEIISHKVDLFAGYIPRLFPFLSDETRRPQTLLSLVRIAEARPGPLRKFTFHFTPFLSDPDPLVRGYTALLLGNLGADETREDLEMLRHESHEISFYENGRLVKKTLGQVASEVLEKL
jgi:HEAT repeat protein